MAMSLGWSSKCTSATGRPCASVVPELSVIRFVDCGMSSPMIHMPAVLRYASTVSVSCGPQLPGATNFAKNAGPSAIVSM